MIIRIHLAWERWHACSHALVLSLCQVACKNSCNNSNKFWRIQQHCFVEDCGCNMIYKKKAIFLFEIQSYMENCLFVWKSGRNSSTAKCMHDLYLKLWSFKINVSETKLTKSIEKLIAQERVADENCLIFLGKSNMKSWPYMQ